MRDEIKGLIGIAAIVAILGTMVFVVYWGRLKGQPREYEGKIAEKWAAYTHSDEGSFPHYRLLVESDTGQSFRSRAMTGWCALIIMALKKFPLEHATRF